MPPRKTFSGAGATHNRAGLVAKIDVEVLNLGGPILPQRRFNTSATSPTNLRRTGEGKASSGASLAIGDGSTPEA